MHIIGSERHESRRIDRQLRGRAGRQGDPGASQFFLSLEDDLMRLFGSERIAKLMDRMGAEEGEVLTHPLITRSIESAQKRVELQNFQARKRLLEYDDVMNQQREVIYSLRSFALEGGEELRAEALKMVDKALDKRVTDLLAEFENETEWDYALLKQELLMHYLLTVPELEGDDPPTTLEAISTRPSWRRGGHSWRRKWRWTTCATSRATASARRLLSLVMLNVLDEKWKDHLYDLDQLRAAIHYRSWGQKDPLIEYKQEAYTMFVDLMGDIHTTFTERFLRAQLVFNAPPPHHRRRSARMAIVAAVRRRRYNATGVLEDVPADEPVAEANRAADGDGSGGAPAPRPDRRRSVRIRPWWARDVRKSSRTSRVGRASRARARSVARGRQARSTGQASGETIRARAGRGRSTRSAMELTMRRCEMGDLR